MKTNYKAIDALDEMLRLAVLERSATTSSDDEWDDQMAEHLFSTPPEILPTEEKSQELLLRLREDLETFGDLLSSALQEQHRDLSAFAETTKLSRETLEQLSQDSLFPNRVPVLLMKGLIELLGASLDKAQMALKRTAALLVESQSFSRSSSSTPVFVRRRPFSKISKEQITTIGAEDFIDPYIAQTAMDVYLQRLETLFATEQPTKGEKDHE